MNNSVWFFGDSFCAANEEGDVPIKGVGCQTIPDYWWGVEFANSLGKEINIQSLGGSSIEYTMLQIEEQMENIQTGDTVVVCYTNPYRLYFNGQNISSNNISDDFTVNNPDHFTQGVLDTAKSFMLHVFDREKQQRLWISHVLYIQNYLIPIIYSKGARIVEFYSFNTIPELKEDLSPKLNGKHDNIFQRDILNNKDPKVKLIDKLKVLPVADHFVIQNASQNGVDYEPILQTPNHFGNNDTEINLNKQWAEYLLTLLPKNT